MDLFLNMLTGAATLLVTKPLSGGIAAWLTTTFLIFVVLPGIAGIFLGKDWASPAFAWWGKWCVLGPLNVVRVGLHAIAQAIERAFSHHFVAEKPLGRILAFGANVGFGIVRTFAQIIVAITSIGGKSRNTGHGGHATHH